MMTTTVPVPASIPVHRVTDRNGNVVARVFRGHHKFFALMCHGEVVHGPFDEREAAEDDALAWVHACEALSMWDSMIDT